METHIKLEMKVIKNEKDINMVKDKINNFNKKNDMLIACTLEKLVSVFGRG